MSTTDSTPPSVAQLADEFARRLRIGERPSLSEYTSRYPEHAEEIRELFPALVALEQFGPEDAAGDCPPSRVEVGGQGGLSQLGDFRIIGEVGRGGMGVVYEAEQVSLCRRVALKVLPKQSLLGSKHAKRFEREARAAARLHHTNIVPVFGVGQQDGLHYYVMQFIHGLGLDEVLVELKRLREQSTPASGGRKPTEPAPVGVQASACVGQPEGWTPTRNDVSAVGVAQSLLSGRFDRTLLVESDSQDSDQPSAISNRPTTSAESKIQNPKSKIPAPSTTLAHLSDTFPLPGQSEQTSKSHSRAVYWQSVARIGVQAAGALQYAHDQGVIHRDVKPGNLLLDTRGCVWVTDFGLAKATDQQDLTHTGDVLGTLRYMAPEQFDGQADARSDVYSLGLTLYELLTLQPAFDESERHNLVKQVTTGTPARVRTLDRHIPRDLETIVHKAIDRDPACRYATADELAADLQRFLADEPIHARRPPALQRLAKWTRRHRGIVSTASLCFLLGSVLLAGVFGWIVRDRESRQSRLAAHVGLLLDEVRRLEQQQRWPEALAVAQRAQAVAAGSRAELGDDKQVRQTLQDLEMLVRLEKIRLKRAEIHNGEFDDEGAVTAYTQEFRDFGVDLELLPTGEAVARLRYHAAILLPLAAAIDDFADARNDVFGAGDAGSLSLVAVARGLDPDLMRDRVRASLGRAVTPELQAELKALAESIDVGRQPPVTLVLLTQTLTDFDLDEVAQSLLRHAQLLHPGDFWINVELADNLYRGRNAKEAIRFYSAAVASRPSANSARINLGRALIDIARLEEAEAVCRQAIALDPKFALAHVNLGAVLTMTGRLAEAEAVCRHAIALDPELAVAHDNLGTVLARAGRLMESEAAYRQAIKVDSKYASAHYNLGVRLDESGRLVEAEAAYRQAIALDSKFARAHDNLGALLARTRRLAEAEAAWRQAIASDPLLANAHDNLGGLLSRTGRLEEALVAHRRAIALDSRHARAHNNLGVLLAATDLLEEAEAAYRRAIELDENFALAHNNLGLLLKATDRLEEAEAAYRQAIKFDLKFAPAQYNLGVLLQETGRLEEAEVAYRRAIDLDQHYARAQYNLGVILDESGRLEEAEAAYRRSLEIGPEQAEPHCNLGLLLMWHTDRFAEAVSQLERGHELGIAQGNWMYPSAQWVAEAKRLLALDRKFADLVNDGTEPDEPAQALALADFALSRKNSPALAGRLFAEHLGEGSLDEAVRIRHVYNAACAVGRVAAGDVEEQAAEVSETEMTAWRMLALDWLRMHLTDCRQRLTSGNVQDREAATNELSHSLQDRDLAAFQGLALDLFSAEEQAAWRQYWSDVERALQTDSKSDP